MKIEENHTVKLLDIVLSATRYLRFSHICSDSKAAYICVQSKRFKNDSKNSG